MRIAFLVLLLVNVVLFAWGQGYLGMPDDGSEPSRLAQQIAPEKLRILPAPASPPLSPPADLPADPPVTLPPAPAADEKTIQ